MAEKECIDTYRQECVQLRARIELLEAQLAEVRAHRDHERRQNKRLSAENAGLRQDAARLDWLEKKGTQHTYMWSPGHWVNRYSLIRTDHDDLRSAIDAARGGK